MRKLVLLLSLLGAIVAQGEIQIINGMKFECVNGMCRPVDDDIDMFADESASEEPVTPAPAALLPARITQGYRPAAEFVQWLEGKDVAQEDVLLEPEAGLASLLLTLLLILVGGLAMNLTPCVLPMIPINLMIIGKSASRGAWYGLGIALAYGAMGVAAAVGGLAFGTIQGSPWFNLGIAILFVALALALSGVFFIDLSKKRGEVARKKTTMLPWLFAFVMGLVSAVLAGACVAPILISVLLLTAKLYAEGQVFALALPFVLGLGMALPWPFLGAGLQVLPKPGAWMKWVNRAFALLVLGFAIWYGRLAYLGFESTSDATTTANSATPETFPARLKELKETSTKPILVDCWATWCKNCAAMEREMEKPEARDILQKFELIRLQSEDMKALKALPGFADIQGLPAFVIFE